MISDFKVPFFCKIDDPEHRIFLSTFSPEQSFIDELKAAEDREL